MKKKFWWFVNLMFVLSILFGVLALMDSLLLNKKIISNIAPDIGQKVFLLFSLCLAIFSLILTFIQDKIYNNSKNTNLL